MIERILISSSIWNGNTRISISQMPFFLFRTQPYNRNRIDWPEPYFCFTARVILKCPLRLNDGIVSPRSTSLRG